MSKTVYGFRNPAGELVYIGATNNPTLREYQHRQSGGWCIAELTFESLSAELPTAEGFAEEARLIRQHEPIHNNRHTSWATISGGRPKGHYLNPDRLDEYMEARGKTLTLVAEEADITRATLSGLYGQHHAASLPVAHRLAQSTGMRVGSLFPMLSTQYVPARVAREGTA